MFKIKPTKAEREAVFDSEYQASGFIPYYTHWNDSTVITKNNDLISVIKVGGFSFETADDDNLNINKNRLNMLLKGLSDSNIGLYFHVVRKKNNAYPKDYSSNDMPDGFAKYLDQKWFAKHQKKHGYINELYISIIRKSTVSSGLGAIDKVLQKLGLSGKESIWQSKMNDAAEQLEESVSRVINTLSQYSARLLELKQTKYGVVSEITEFFGRIVNCGVENNVMLPSGDMSKYICNSRLYFGNKSIECKGLDGKSKYAGIVSLKEYGPKTWPGLFDSFLQMPFEFVMTQSFEFIHKQTAVNKMQLQQNRMVQAGDKAFSQIAEITEALDLAMSGEIGFGTHHLTVMAMADDLKTLDYYLSLSSVELTNTGGIGVREKVNLEPAFWGQLPGNFDFIVRKSVVNTLNVSAFNSFHNYPFGQAKKNHWGDAVTVLDTTSGTPFYFNFHVRDIGHTTIIGPTGGGKTVMMNFLCAQARKFRCRLFFFDKDRGAEIFLRALGGEYTTIKPGDVCGLNPLKLPDTGENRTFLLEWMKHLISTNGETISAEDISALSGAINGNYKLEYKDRKLSNIAPFLGLEGPSTIAGRMSMWYGKGSHAKVFDNDIDVIDFDKATVFGFEMGGLLKDPASLGPVLAYIFHRINLSLDGTPSMIVLDEAWALIDNPIFGPTIKDWLKVLRKLNTFVVFATQSVEDAASSDISDTLIQQTATQIFLPNLKATNVYKTAFMLSNRELNIIKTTDPGSRYFLVKQGNDSVVAKIDLQGMDDIINVLSGRAETTSLLADILEKYGDNPDVWVPEFNKKVKEILET